MKNVAVILLSVLVSACSSQFGALSSLTVGQTGLQNAGAFGVVGPIGGSSVLDFPLDGPGAGDSDESGAFSVVLPTSFGNQPGLLRFNVRTRTYDEVHFPWGMAGMSIKFVENSNEFLCVGLGGTHTPMLASRVYCKSKLTAPRAFLESYGRDWFLLDIEGSVSGLFLGPSGMAFVVLDEDENSVLCFIGQAIDGYDGPEEDVRCHDQFSAVLSAVVQSQGLVVFSKEGLGTMGSVDLGDGDLRSNLTIVESDVIGGALDEDGCIILWKVVEDFHSVRALYCVNEDGLGLDGAESYSAFEIVKAVHDPVSSTDYMRVRTQHATHLIIRDSQGERQLAHFEGLLLSSVMDLMLVRGQGAYFYGRRITGFSSNSGGFGIHTSLLVRAVWRAAGFDVSLVAREKNSVRQDNLSDSDSHATHGSGPGVQDDQQEAMSF